MSTKATDYPNPGSHWWLVLIQGLVAIVVGILLISNPAGTIVALVPFLGIYWLITGVINLITPLWNRSQWGWKVFTGIVGIIAGLLIIQNPLISTLVVPATIALVLGIIGFVFGIGLLIQAFRGGGWGVGVLGALSILLGLALIVRPLVAGLSLAFLLGILLVLGGILAIIAAFSLRSLSEEYKKAEAMPSPVVGQAGSTVTGTATRTGDMMAGVAGAGVGAVVGAGMDTATRAEEDIAEVTDTGMDTATRSDDEIAGDVTSGAVWVVGEDMDTAKRADEEIAGGETAAFTGNVNPLDADEMAKYHRFLEYVEGIGPGHAEKLKAIGIHNCLDLIKAGNTARGRSEIAEKSGINGGLILEWINHVDLYRIKGVGSEYADLLEASGVDTVVELAQRKPETLFEKLNSVNLEKHLVRRLPTLSQVDDWVAQAKGLPRVVTD